MKDFKQIRFELNLTQRQVAKKTGLAKSTVANIETGHREITVNHAIAIARGLNVIPTFDLKAGKVVFSTREEFQKKNK